MDPAPALDRLPPPYLGAGNLGAAPDPAMPVGEDPILAAYGDEADEPADEAPGLPIGPDEITAGLVAIFDLAAQLRGDHWRVEPAETAMLAPPLARQLAKPDNAAGAWLMAHGDAVMIAAGLAIIVLPRAAIEYQVIRYRRRALELQDEEAPVGYPEPANHPPTAGPGSGISADGSPIGQPRPADAADLAATLGALTGR